MSQQVEVGTGTDSVTIEVQDSAELENHSLAVDAVSDTELQVEETLASSEEEQLQGLIYRVLQAMQEIVQNGDSLVAIYVNPGIEPKFTEGFRSLPDEMLPQEIRDKLPIVADENVNPLRIITSVDLEMQFLQERYGPREAGGNGLLVDLTTAMQRDRVPVKLTHDFLRLYYLMELAEQVKPKLYQPNGSNVIQFMDKLTRK